MTIHMARGEVLDRIADHRADFGRYHVKALYVFGSVARGEDRPDSDVDVLVDFASSPTFDDFMGLKIYLEDLLGRRVDLVTRNALRPRLREAIVREAIHAA